MAEAVGALRIDIFADNSQFRAGLASATKDLKRFSRDAQKIGDGFKNIGAAFSIGITAPFALFALKAKDAARDAAELQSAFDFSFGEMAGAANDWAETTGNAIGRSTQTLQQAAFEFQQLFRQAAPTSKAAYELSTSFAVLASDVASFLNLSDEEAMQRLRAGLSGEAEPLRRLGVFINEASVKQRAYQLEIAKTGAELTDQQKILARASLIMEGLSVAQGDVTRTAASLANQERSLKEEFRELMVDVGKELVPVMLDLVGAAKSVLMWFKELSPETKRNILLFAGMAAAIGPVLIVIGTLVGSVGTLVGGLATVAKFMGTSSGAAALLTSKYVALAAALGLAYAQGRIFGDMLADQIKKSDEALKIWYAAPKWLGGFGGAAEDAAEAVRRLRDEQTAAAINGDLESLASKYADINAQTDAAATSTDDYGAEIQALLGDLGNLDQATDFLTEHKSDIERIREAIDPVGEAVKAWTADLYIAGRAGLDVAAAEKALGMEAVQAAGGLDVMAAQLDRLPPALQRVVEAMREKEWTDFYTETLAELAATGDEFFQHMEDSANSIDITPFSDEAAALAAQLNDQFNSETALERRIEAINKALATGKLEAGVYEKAIADAMNGEPERDRDRARMVRDISGSLSDLLTGTKSFEDAWRDMLSQILQTRVVQPILDNMVDSIFPKQSGGKGTSGFDVSSALAGIGSFFGSVFGGFRANGGDVMPGKAYMVGERGREIFVPDVPGNIVPNDERGAYGAGMRGGDVVFNVQTPDANSFRASQRQLSRRAREAMEGAR